MKLGFNMLLWATHVSDAHLPILQDINSTGYDGVEIPMFEGDPEYFRALGIVFAISGFKRWAWASCRAAARMRYRRTLLIVMALWPI